LRPFYNEEEVKKFDFDTTYSRGLDGTDYLPGFVGLNNIKATDYVNVMIQALCHIPDLRDFLIFHENNKYTSDVFDFDTLLSKRCEFHLFFILNID
jgi:U4/U6.U5 tri-snRNP-associated protein 2